MSRPVGPPQPDRSRVDRTRCPSGADCRVARSGFGQPRLWELVASRRLNCRPDGGDSARACAALRLLLHPPRRTIICDCLMIGAESWRIDGRVDGRDVHRRIDACSLGCGASPRLAAAVHVLFSA